MKKNKLGQSDLLISETGFGTMSLPKDETEAVHLIHEALEQGINFFDTADVYDFGRIEEVLGKALKGRRNEAIITTKGGNHWEPGKEGWYWDPSKKYIKQALKNSLKRLGTDYVDLYQLHGGTIDDPIDETIEALDELKKEGLIRYYGISSIRPNVISEYLERSSIVSVLTQYSLLDRRPEENVLDMLESHDVGAIVRGPVAKGLLTESGEKKLTDKGYLDYSKDEVMNVLRAMDESSGNNRSRAHTAMQYVLQHPAVKSIIPGASRLSQLKENCALGSSKMMTEEEYSQLQKATKASRYEQHRI